LAQTGKIDAEYQTRSPFRPLDEGPHWDDHHRILFYLKCYPTFDLAGLLYGVDRAQAQRWVKVLLPVLEEVLGWQTVLPQRRIGTLEEFIQRFPAVKDVFIDGTERPVQRPQQAKAQRELYSGKQHEHTLKNLIVSDVAKRILCLTQTKPGARQDYYRFKQAGSNILTYYRAANTQTGNYRILDREDTSEVSSKPSLKISLILTTCPSVFIIPPLAI
jgi:hypothetical protein